MSLKSKTNLYLTEISYAYQWITATTVRYFMKCFHTLLFSSTFSQKGSLLHWSWNHAPSYKLHTKDTQTIIACYFPIVKLTCPIIYRNNCKEECIYSMPVNWYKNESSRTITPGENCPSTLTLTLTQTLTLTAGQFSSRAVVRKMKRKNETQQMSV